MTYMSFSSCGTASALLHEDVKSGGEFSPPGHAVGAVAALPVMSRLPRGTLQGHLPCVSFRDKHGIHAIPIVTDETVLSCSARPAAEYAFSEGKRTWMPATRRSIRIKKRPGSTPRAVAYLREAVVSSSRAADNGRR